MIDDHAAMREGIRAVISAQPDMIMAGEAKDGAEGVQLFRKLKTDVTLVDWNLPIIRGDEVIASLIAEFPHARFIVITALDDGSCVQRALDLGAQACLHKDRLRRELLPAIRAIYRGQPFASENVLNRIRKND
ncbi:MAG TPA: response regulator transcription factor [Verrucomicrobiae bacterium]|nr:response regulator transcription factor [Verrucomicrobiae bacterium]